MLSLNYTLEFGEFQIRPSRLAVRTHQGLLQIRMDTPQGLLSLVGRISAFVAGSDGQKHAGGISRPRQIQFTWVRAAFMVTFRKIYFNILHR